MTGWFRWRKKDTDQFVKGYLVKSFTRTAYDSLNH